MTIVLLNLKRSYTGLGPSPSLKSELSFLDLVPSMRQKLNFCSLAGVCTLDDGLYTLAFVNKVLWGHSHTPPFTCFLWLLWCFDSMAKLNSRTRDHITCKAKNIFYLTLDATDSLTKLWIIRSLPLPGSHLPVLFTAGVTTYPAHLPVSG